jgi:hypothetical protein
VSGTKKTPKETPPPVSAPRPGWRRRLCFFAALPLAGAALIAWFGVGPWLAMRGARRAATDSIRGRFDVRWARLGWKTVVLEGATLRDGSGREVARAERIDLALARPFWERGPFEIEKITVHSPDLLLHFDAEGRLDMQDTLAPPDRPQPASGGSSAPSSPAPPGPLERVEIRGGRLVLTGPSAGAEFRDVNGDLRVEPRRLVLDGLEAESVGGRVSILGRIETGSDRGWALQFAVAGADAREVVRRSGVDPSGIRGRVDGFLSLDRPHGGRVAGAGWLEAREGRFYGLPVIFSVFSLLKLEEPGEQVVDTVRCEFEVRGPEIRISRAHLMSSVLSLFGDGVIHCDTGRIEFDFVPRPGGRAPEGFRSLEDDERAVGDFIKRNLLIDVEIRGTWSKPEGAVMPLRVITRPLKDFFALLAGEEER